MKVRTFRLTLVSLCMSLSLIPVAQAGFLEDFYECPGVPSAQVAMFSCEVGAQ